MPKQQVKTIIQTANSSLSFSVKPSILGKELFMQVVKILDLREHWYFGLKYTDAKGQELWLKFEKKVFSQCSISKEKPVHMKFCIKFYPENVEEIILCKTLTLFYEEVKDLIMTDKIFCPAEVAVLLAACILQVQNEKMDPESPPKMEINSLIREGIIDQHKLTADQWMERILEFWRQLADKDMDKEKSMREYLLAAQDLEMYGVTYFEIKNKKGSELLLGVDALGINVYEKNDKLTPKIGFPWSEIRNISFNDKKFIIKPTDKKAPDFILMARHLSVNESILALCMGNHALYIKRRNAEDSPDVQLMKYEKEQEEAKKQADAATKRAEREEMRKTKEEKDDLARQNENMVQRLKQMEEKQFQNKEALERLLNENEELKMKYEEERAGYECKLLEVERELVTTRETVMVTEEEKRAKAARMQELEEEFHELKRQKEQLEKKDEERMAKEYEMRAHHPVNEMRSHQPVILSSGGVRHSMTTRQSPTVQTFVVPTQPIQAASSYEPVRKPSLNVERQNSLTESDQAVVINGEDSGVDKRPRFMAQPDQSSLNTDTDELTQVFARCWGPDDQSGETRYMGKRVEDHMYKLKDKDKNLKEMKLALQQAVIEERKTKMDLLHNENMHLGRNKTKTLQRITSGNTKHRITEFEKL